VTHLPALATILGTGVLVGAEYAHHMPTKIVAKTGAAWGFVMYALTLGAWEAGAVGRWIVLGLVLSMVGDVALLSRDKRAFLGGLVAFLLAHVAYVIAFLNLGVSWLAVGLTAVPLAWFATKVWQWLQDHVGTLGPAVMAYIAVITTMVAASVGSLVDGPSWLRLGLVLAATLFFLSDLCVARDRFVEPGPENRYVGLPLYFGAQLLFAYFGAAVI
jgi:uncharacterized membrane protein YhhN